ncbi:hypothetical protein C2E21_1004 [Chlorella sorokiniana]|uniref:Uncharacterized protein n=1 Tax=Chlorella sorokiniana TaxID=3076 RepID=A0A2P6U3D5_CHLSO|nr:hypothetical protein C2E21_1004 [Chlorella sorokiniana]|eukprot:PRW60824.1 hypothetical protein C2E21_1004 [Chlorella sorokiniana]
MVGARGRVALCLGLLLVVSTASGRQLKQAEQPVVGVVAPVVGSVPLERGPAPGPEGALLLTGPPILVAGTITVPATEPAGRETITTTRGLKQADIAPTAVAVLGAPVAESLLGTEGTGRRLQQGGESMASQLLAPIAESLSMEQPGTGRRLQQGVGEVGGGLGVERTIPATESIGAEQLGTTGRRLQQAGESMATQLLAPIAESLSMEQPGTGRRLQQESGSVVTAVGPSNPPQSELGQNLAESASIGRRLQQAGFAPSVEAAVESALTGRRLSQMEAGATPSEAITPGSAAAPTPVLTLPGVAASAPMSETMGRRLAQAETGAPMEIPTTVMAPVAELPEPVGRRLQQVSSGAGSSSDLSAVGSVGHGQLPAPSPSSAPSSEGK